MNPIKQLIENLGVFRFAVLCGGIVLFWYISITTFVERIAEGSILNVFGSSWISFPIGALLALSSIPILSRNPNSFQSSLRPITAFMAITGVCVHFLPIPAVLSTVLDHFLLFAAGFVLHTISWLYATFELGYRTR